MATHAPITGAPTRAPSLELLGSLLDDVSADTSIVRSLVRVSMDTENKIDAGNTLYAALRVMEAIDRHFDDLQSTLAALHKAAERTMRPARAADQEGR